MTAKEAVRKGKAWGVLHFSENYTTSIMDRLELGRLTPDKEVNNSNVELWMDMSSKLQCFVFCQKLLITPKLKILIYNASNYTQHWNKTFRKEKNNLIYIMVNPSSYTETIWTIFFPPFFYEMTSIHASRLRKDLKQWVDGKEILFWNYEYLNMFSFLIKSVYFAVYDIKNKNVQ